MHLTVDLCVCVCVQYREMNRQRNVVCIMEKELYEKEEADESEKWNERVVGKSKEG